MNRHYFFIERWSLAILIFTSIFLFDFCILGSEDLHKKLREGDLIFHTSLHFLCCDIRIVSTYNSIEEMIPLIQEFIE